jgi:hypothetical protein
MKINGFLKSQTLKILLLLGIIGLGNSILYGQESEEKVDANLSISFVEAENTNKVVVLATDQNNLPIEDLELYFYVKRTFSLLPFGDTFNSTDENGRVEVNFPNDLPGDHQANVTIIVKLFDSDLYNDQQIENVKNWGIATPPDHVGEERSLWAAAANAPIPLVLGISSMIASIWFIILYIFYILFKISKIKPLKA